jgi:hypothetical protein
VRAQLRRTAPVAITCCAALIAGVATGVAAPHRGVARPDAATAIATGKPGHLAYVTADNRVESATISVSGNAVGVTNLGPVTNASGHHQILIQSFLGAGNGNWLAWQEVTAKRSGTPTGATPTLVLREVNPSNVFELKTDDIPLGFAGNHLITYGAHTDLVSLTPTVHLHRLAVAGYPLAPAPNGVVSVKALSPPPGTATTRQVRVTSLDGSAQLVHNYVVSPKDTALPATAYASPDLNRLIVELGDHTDFGGIGPSSLVDEYPLDGGMTKVRLGHYGSAAKQWRVGGASFIRKADKPVVLWERATKHGAVGVVAVYRHNKKWTPLLTHAIAVAGNRSGYAVVQGGRYVFSHDGEAVTRVPIGDAILLGGAQAKVMGIGGSAFAWIRSAT